MTRARRTKKVETPTNDAPKVEAAAEEEVKPQGKAQVKKPTSLPKAEEVKVVCAEYPQVNPNTNIRYSHEPITVNSAVIEEGTWEYNQIQAGCLKVL